MNSININYQKPNFKAKHIVKTNVLRNLTIDSQRK